MGVWEDRYGLRSGALSRFPWILDWVLTCSLGSCSVFPFYFVENHTSTSFSEGIRDNPGVWEDREGRVWSYSGPRYPKPSTAPCLGVIQQRSQALHLPWFLQPSALSPGSS